MGETKIEWAETGRHLDVAFRFAARPTHVS